MELARLLRPGATVAVGDGAGAPVELLPELSEAARPHADVHLLLGWCVAALTGLDPSAFSRVSALMGGYAARGLIDAGDADYIPARFGTWPALIRDVVRPDVLLASVVRRRDGCRFVTESAWMWAAVDAGATVAAMERPGPHCVAGPPLPTHQVVLVGSSSKPPEPFAWTAPSSVHEAIAEVVSGLVPAGARLQFPPGALGSAIVGSIHTPVRIDSGVITDSVIDLDRRGFLTGAPLAAYAVGGAELYEWLDGRPVIDRSERTHGAGRLATGPPLFAVNTAFEIDLGGQVNVVSVGGSATAAIGGQPDYMAAAAASIGGASVIAMPTRHQGRSTLVETLSAPASTPSHDVDVVATERGAIDLRGRGRPAREEALRQLWAS